MYTNTQTAAFPTLDRASNLGRGSRQRDRILFHDCSTEFDREAQVTHVRVEALVRRKIDAGLARLVDPQGWSTSCPVYFLNSYKVAQKNGYPVLDGGLPVPDEKRPTLGTAWRGFLFEEVQAANPLLTWHVRNILRIDFEVSRSQRRPYLRMDFSLHQCLWSKLGASVVPGGIDVDSGFIEVTPEKNAPGVVRVVATKSLRFTPRCDFGRVGSTISKAANYLAPPLVGSWMNRLVLVGMAGTTAD